MTNTTKTTMILDSDLLRQVKHVAIDLDITATEFVKQAITEKLQRGNKKK